MRRLWITLAATVLLASILSACSLPGGAASPTITLAPKIIMTATLIAPRATETTMPQVITATPVPATLTSTIAPSSTATLVPSATITPTRNSYTATPATGQTVKIYMIAMGDNGKTGKPTGCNDSVVPVTVSIASTKGVLKAALNSLLAVKTQEYGTSGLYNSLYQSDLSLSSVAITKGVAVIRLTGNVTLGGECDNPRVFSQLEETALQFRTVKSVTIYLNGKNIKSVLSLQN